MRNKHVHTEALRDMKKRISQARLTALLGGIAITLIIISIVAFSMVVVQNRELDHMNTDRYILAMNADRFRDASLFLTSEARAFASTGDTAHRDLFWDEVNNAKNRDIAVETMYAVGVTDEERIRIEEMAELSDRLLGIERIAFKDMESGRADHALTQLYGPVYTEGSRRIQRLQVTFEEMLDARTQQAIRNIQGAVWLWTTVLMVCLTLIALTQVLASALIGKRIIQPIARIRDETLMLSKGLLNSDQELPVDTSEIGMLNHAIAETRHTLSSYISEISFILTRMASGDFAVRAETAYVGAFERIRLSLNAVAEILEAQRAADLKSRVELTEAYEAANYANRSKSDFLSSMSHDIRTPMNAIIGMTAIAQNNMDNEEKVRDCLKRISLSCSHLLGLINDVLDMSSIESGKIVLNNDNTSLPEVIENVVNIAQPLIKAKKQLLNISLSNVMHERLYCDALRLNQVFINILSNAIKFTPPGGNLSLEIEEIPLETEEEAQFAFRFTDTGIGMSTAFIQDIFNAFSRDKNTRAQQIEGSGLGMAICKKIVDMMGGSIQVQSEEGKGSAFTVTLRLRTAFVDDQDLQLNGMRFLLVDDDEATVQGAVQALYDMGAQASYALSGAQAETMLAQTLSKGESFDAIIVDWKMPEMSGVETTRALIRQEGMHSPILVASAYDWSEIEEEALAAGVRGFVSKPLFRSVLYHAVHRYIITDETSAKLPDIQEENDFSNLHALLVEDIELNRMVVEELLAPTGIHLETAENGAEALTRFQESEEGSIALILMDVQMPIMNGYEATRHIRALPRADAKTVPIIAMTANSFAEDVRTALEAGMNSHVAKPIDIVRLKKEIQHYTSKGRA